MVVILGMVTGRVEVAWADGRHGFACPSEGAGVGGIVSAGEMRLSATKRCLTCAGLPAKPATWWEERPAPGAEAAELWIDDRRASDPDLLLSGANALPPCAESSAFAELRSTRAAGVSIQGGMRSGRRAARDGRNAPIRPCRVNRMNLPGQRGAQGPGLAAEGAAIVVTPSGPSTARIPEQTRSLRGHAAAVAELRVAALPYAVRDVPDARRSPGCRTLPAATPA